MVKIIAEIGVNHGGDVSTAIHMIDAAKKCGADAVKFQMFDSEKLEAPGDRREMLKGLEFGHYELQMLYNHCFMEDIEFMCTPFDVDSLKFLVGIGMKSVKIASGNLNNFELLNAAKETGLPIYLSTGGAEYHEIVACMLSMRPAPITLMHCTSAYPCPPEDVNIRALLEIMDLAPKYGYSDHTNGDVAAIMAVALGASVIEKHFTTERGSGPDHEMSMMSNRFMGFVDNLRVAEAMKGDGEKRIMPSETLAVEVMDQRRLWREGVHTG